MPEQALINDRDEAISYLVLEKNLVDARILLDLALHGVKTWLIASKDLPPSIDGGDSYWLFQNGEIVNTHVVGPSIKVEYERQTGSPFPSGTDN